MSYLVNNESEIQRILSIPIESDDEFADIGQVMTKISIAHKLLIFIFIKC
jgi:hypothetical protein